MTDNDLYYRQRIDEELAAADAADDAAISRIHHDMAERYRGLLGAAPPAKRAANGEPGTVYI